MGVPQGLYYSWGNVEGHLPGDGYSFSSSAYDSSPGAEVDTSLSGVNDAATVALGDGWSVPGRAHFSELRDNCSITLYTRDGRRWWRLYGPNGNHIDIPAGGTWDGSEVRNETTSFHLWLATYQSDSQCYQGSSAGQNFSLKAVERYLGYNIRPIYSP